jgi:hypothetical protein
MSSGRPSRPPLDAIEYSRKRPASDRAAGAVEMLKIHCNPCVDSASIALRFGPMSSVPARRVPPLAALSVALSASPGCGGGSSDVPPPMLASVAPRQAYSDTAVAIALGGMQLRPALALDTTGGDLDVGTTPFAVSLRPAGGGDAAADAGGMVRATDVTWKDGATLTALIPAGVPAGAYDVVVADPRGRAAALRSGFTSLGPDDAAPGLTIDPPTGSAFPPGASVRVTVSADDGEGHVRQVRWSVVGAALASQVGTCPQVGQPMQVGCSFVFLAPPAADGSTAAVDVRAEADDSAGNTATASAQLLSIPPPIIAVLEPMAGSTAGGTRIVVTGTGFIPGMTELRVDGVALELDPSAPPTATTLTGLTGAHLPGFGGVTAGIGASQSSTVAFQFVSPPVLRLLSPTSGPEAAATSATLAGSHFRNGVTRVFVGDGVTRTEVAVDFVSATRLDITIPPGSGVVSVYAVDPDSGEAALPDAFAYLPAGPQPGGS